MTILFPTDFSDSSVKSFEYAYQFAKATNLPITLLHVYAIPMPTAGIDDFTWADVSDEIIAAAELSTTQRMAAFKLEVGLKYSQAHGQTVRVDEVIKMGFIADQIMSTAEQLNAEFIIIGVHETNAIQRALFGSTAAHIIKKSKIPVLVVPEKATYNAIAKIAYATDLTFADQTIISNLLHLGSILNAEVKCFHVHDSNLDVENSIIKDFIEQYKNEANAGKITFQLIDNSNILDGIDFFVQENSIDLVAMLSQKKYWIEFFESSITKKMAFHSDVPLLIYNE